MWYRGVASGDCGPQLPLGLLVSASAPLVSGRVFEDIAYDLRIAWRVLNDRQE